MLGNVIAGFILVILLFVGAFIFVGSILALVTGEPLKLIMFGKSDK